MGGFLYEVDEMEGNLQMDKLIVDEMEGSGYCRGVAKVEP
jgi:CYTH domain-containing protein